MQKSEISKIAARYGVSEGCATHIFYLRTRARWTQRAEEELVRRHKAGEPSPNMNEWPEEGSEFRDFSMKDFVEKICKDKESSS